MAAGRHFEKKKNRHNSAIIWDVFTKFGTQVDMDRPQRAVTSFLTYNTIQGGSRSLESWSNLGDFRAFQKYWNPNLYDVGNLNSV